MSPATDTTLRIRQTYLRCLLDQCPAMAYALAVEKREGPHFGGASRGTAVHEVFSRYAVHLYETERETDWEAAERLAREVLDEHPEISYADRLDVLEQAANIGRGFLFERAAFYGAEEALEAELDLRDGRSITVTGRLDLLLSRQADFRVARIVDCKSNHNLPPDAAVREDTQLAVYAWLTAQHLAVDAVEGELWFTRYNVRLPRRAPAVWYPDDLAAFEDHLRVKVRAFLDAGERQEFVPGNHCQYCPRRRPGDCARWQRSFPVKALRSHQEAARAGARLVALEQQADALKAALKAYVNEHGPLRIGSTAKAETWDFWESRTDEYAVSEVLDLLDGPAGQAYQSEHGVVRLDDIARPDTRGRTFRQMLKSRELGEDLRSLATPKTTTTFRHKGGGEGD